MLTVSSITGFLYCPRKLYLTKILGFVEPQKEATVLGSLRHEIYDRINKIEKDIIFLIKDKNINSIIYLYKQKYSQIVRDSIISFKPKLQILNLNLSETFQTIWPFLEKEYNFRALNVFEFIQEHKIIGEELWEKLTPKIESEVKVSSIELELTGVVDRIEIYKGNIIPAELKTGKAPKSGIWADHKIQLAAYMLLLEEKYGMEIKGGYVHYLSEDVKYDVIMNPFLKEEVKELVKKVKNLFDSSEIPPKIQSKSKCDTCSLKEEFYD